jgi:hypothetical protein
MEAARRVTIDWNGCAGHFTWPLRLKVRCGKSRASAYAQMRRSGGTLLFWAGLKLSSALRQCTTKWRTDDPSLTTRTKLHS